MEIVSRNNIMEVYSWFEKISDREDFTDSFKFFVLRNIDKLKEEVSTIRNFSDSLKPSPEYMLFERERLDLVDVYAVKNSDGSLMTIENPEDQTSRYFMGDNDELFNIEYAKLTDKYYDVIVDNDTSVNDFTELLREDIEVDITKISFKKLPKNISIQILHLLRPFLKETMEEIEDELLNDEG